MKKMKSQSKRTQEGMHAANHEKGILNELLKKYKPCTTFKIIDGRKAGTKEKIAA